MAMAEAFSAVDGGVESMGYNPAGIVGARPVLETLYTHGAIDDHFSFTGYAHPLPFGTLCAGLAYYDAGTVRISLSDGTNESRKAQQDLVALAGASVPLGLGFSAGGLVKSYRLELAQAARATGYAADGGVIWHSPVAGLNFGASLQNLGPNVKYEQEGDPLPATARYGLAYELKLERFGLLKDVPYTINEFLFTADQVKVKDERSSAALGLEMGMPLGQGGHGAVRFGYVFNRDLDSFSFGLGFREGRFIFDYALGVKRAFNNLHHFSVGVYF